ncbi:MAG TPA: zinc-ribbon domain-containing protein [Syntrophobacter fumaroxidans]|nr:zinc-ribbon domain-containing protein [Syntrophobacter fumaroxidans]
MIVRCPQCNREYNVDERLLSPKGAMGKCKPCGIRFKIEPPGGSEQEVTCPKCGFKQVGGTECRTCGVMFDKLSMESASEPAPGAGSFTASERKPGESFDAPPPLRPLTPQAPQLRSAAGAGGSEFVIGEAISFGWQTVKANMGFFVLLTLATIVIEMIPGIFQGIIAGNSILLILIFWVISMVVQGIVTMGYVSICLAFADGRKAGFEQLFSCTPLVLSYVVATIICSLAVGIGFLLLIVPGVIFIIKLMFYTFAIVDKNMGPVESLNASWNMTKDVKMDLLLLLLLLLVINIIGAIPLGLGLLITVPVSSLACAYVYRRLQRRIEGPAASGFAA